jgi:hypothetical protein
MINNLKASYDSLDLGSSAPIGIAMEKVEIEIDPQEILGNYAKAFVNECYRNAPELVERINFSEEEVINYCKFLMKQRVDCVHQECRIWGKLKALWIPTWIQYNLSMIGEVVMVDKGLDIIPVMKDDKFITYQEAYEISQRIHYFRDYVQIVTDAMPRGIYGDKDVMTTAVVANYVRAQSKVEHVAATYVTAFLNMKLKEEVAMAALYRVQYDDIEFIRAALTNAGGII